MKEILRDIIRTADGKFVMIDTRDTPDRGWETMVFKCDRNGRVSARGWSNPLGAMTYKSIENANAGHAKFVSRWGQGKEYKEDAEEILAYINCGCSVDNAIQRVICK